jgi:acetylornithine/N-succinyldiaminopimelate aminotransferase
MGVKRMNREEIFKCNRKYFMNVFSGRYPLVVDHGEGIKLYDKDGKEYIDLLAGIGVNALGYGNYKLNTAIKEQVDKVLHCSNLYYIEPQAYLEKLLVEKSFADRVFFANSGAEVNEGAIKLARKYFEERNQNKYEIITAINSFHGRTLATLAATGQKKFQVSFKPLPEGFKYVTYNDFEELKNLVSNKTAAIMLEPVQGEGGVYPADKEYLKKVRNFCNEKGILLIFDEIQCGMGRTGTLFAYEQYEVEPDIITLAKALGGGIPMGAFMATKEVADAFKPGDHGSTFGGNHLSSIAAYTSIKILIEDGVLENVKISGDYFRLQLENLTEEFNIIKEIRGKGLMLALEFTDNINAKEITMKLFEEGFLVNAVQEHTLRFLPPLIIKKKEIDLFILKLKKLLKNLN